MPRPRLRTFTLWTGTTLCVLIVAAFVVSAWWEVAVQVPTSNGPTMNLRGGSVGFIIDDVLDARARIWPHGYSLLSWNSWAWQRIDRRIRGGPTLSVTYIEIPLFAVFLAVAIPTLLAWRFWPKPVKPGHCRCGYDLRGNESGMCPECGIEVQA